MGEENEIDREFQELMRRIREGDQQAAWDLLELYGPHLRRVVRCRMHAKLRSKFDSIDFVQSVWGAFFTDAEKLRKFEQPKDLIAFLAKMARNKVYEETRRRFEYQRYRLSREQPLDEHENSAHAIDPGQHRASEIAVVRERWNRTLSKRSQLDLQILEMRFQGSTFDEIAAALNVNEKMARRVIQEIIGGVIPSSENEMG